MDRKHSAGCPRRWDLFCRVIDNLGDIGTCWRLARQLTAEFPCEVRIWVDNLDALATLCPAVATDKESQTVNSIDIRRWPSHDRDFDVADVVVEAFACELPAAYIAGMARRQPSPIWINLEYLSAEGWIEDCHCVKSPHPTHPLTKHFFFPGFTTRTGGLLKERHLERDRTDFDTTARNEFLRSIGVATEENELLISLFCYNNAALPDLLAEWSNGSNPVRVLVTPGFATTQVEAWFQQVLPAATTVRRGSLAVNAIPYLSPDQFDRLLWSCDLNFVRGEDSFVRAQWACKPFVWQIYPQSDAVHLVKLDAFLSSYLRGFEHSPVVFDLWHAWNGVGRIVDRWGMFFSIRQSLEEHAKQWSQHLDRTGNLANNLVLFVQNRC